MTLIKSIRAAAIGISAMGLSACAYSGDTGYYDDTGYEYGYNDPYCDDYYEYDRYYDCDYRAGFANIGFGGGYYDNFYYPGYGIYIFDRGGTRYRWQERHRRYWAQQRYRWHAGRRGDGRRGDAYRGDRRDLTPAQRAERRERRAERRDRRGRDGSRRGQRDNGVDATAGRIIDRAQRREERRGSDGVRNGRSGERSGTRGGRRGNNVAQPPRGQRTATPPAPRQQAAPAPRAAPAKRSSSPPPTRSRGDRREPPSNAKPE